MDENSPLTSSATAGPRGVIAGWPPDPVPPSPGPSIAYPPHPTKQTRNPTPHPSYRGMKPPPTPTPPLLPRRETTPPVGAALVAALPSPRVISPLPPAPYLLYPHTILSPPVIPAEIADAESAPTAYAYRVPRGPNPPRETKQSTIVPAPHKQSTPKPISLIDPPPPPPSFLRRQESIPPEGTPPVAALLALPPPSSPPTPIPSSSVIPAEAGMWIHISSATRFQ